MSVALLMATELTMIEDPITCLDITIIRSVCWAHYSTCQVVKKCVCAVHLSCTFMECSITGGG